MVVNREQLELEGRCIIERLIIQSPFRYNAVFDNEACFLFFKDSQTILYAADNSTQISRNGHVLLNCGNYYADIIPVSPNKKVEIIAVHLYPDLLKEITSFGNDIRQTPSHTHEHSEAYECLVQQYMQSLLPYFTFKQFSQPFILKLKLQELMFVLLQSGNKQSAASLLIQLFTPREANIQSIVATHLYSKLNVHEMASLASMSTSTFKRAFKSLYGESPASYLRIKKLDKARHLLQYSSLTVNEICYEVGFSDPAHFNRAFKNQTGFSPAAFRSNNAGKTVEPISQ